MKQSKKVGQKEEVKVAIHKAESWRDVTEPPTNQGSGCLNDKDTKNYGGRTQAGGLSCRCLNNSVQNAQRDNK